MAISQKCQYGLRAIFELAKRHQQGPSRIGEIAAAQAIPTRFLEVILNELKQGGFVDSRRGKEGGYLLAREPREINVGEVIRFIQGPLYPVEDLVAKDAEGAPELPGIVFVPVWRKLESAVAGVLDATNFQQLVEDEKNHRGRRIVDFSI